MHSTHSKYPFTDSPIRGTLSRRDITKTYLGFCHHLYKMDTCSPGGIWDGTSLWSRIGHPSRSTDMSTDLNHRQRVAVPYTPCHGDDAAHQQKAAAGLCYRLVCPNVAHHGWRNTGMEGAKYCLTCVRMFSKINPNLFVPVEDTPDNTENQSPESGS